METDASGGHDNADFSGAIQKPLRDFHIPALADHPNVAVRHRAKQVTSGDHPQAPIRFGHIVHGDPRGNEGNRIETEIRAVLMIGLLDPPRRLHEELLAFQLDIRTKQAFDGVEDSWIPRGIAEDGIIGVAMVQLSDCSKPAINGRAIIDHRTPRKRRFVAVEK